MLYPIFLFLMKLTLRSYKFCMAQCYIPEHIDTNEGLDILFSDGISGLMSAKFALASSTNAGLDTVIW